MGGDGSSSSSSPAATAGAGKAGRGRLTAIAAAAAAAAAAAVASSSTPSTAPAPDSTQPPSASTGGGVGKADPSSDPSQRASACDPRLAAVQDPGRRRMAKSPSCPDMPRVSFANLTLASSPVVAPASASGAGSLAPGLVEGSVSSASRAPGAHAAPIDFRSSLGASKFWLCCGRQ